MVQSSCFLGTLGFVGIVALGFFIAPRLRGLYAARPSITVIDTVSPTATFRRPSVHCNCNASPYSNSHPIDLEAYLHGTGIYTRQDHRL